MDMTDAEKIQKAYELLRSVRDDIYRLFSVGFNRIPQSVSAAERSFVEKLLKQYDYEAVRDGFEEAVAQGVQKLSYVRGCAKSFYEQRAVKKNIAEHEKMKKEEKNIEYADFSKDKEFQALLNSKKYSGK